MRFALEGGQVSLGLRLGRWSREGWLIRVQQEDTFLIFGIMMPTKLSTILVID